MVSDEWRRWAMSVSEEWWRGVMSYAWLAMSDGEVDDVFFRVGDA